MYKQKNYFSYFNGLRGVAVLMVVLHHFIGTDNTRNIVEKFIFDRIQIFGRTGVELFFVISGFLIIGILLDSKESKNYFKTFYIRRILRIFPLYFFMLIISLILIPQLVQIDNGGG